MKNNPVPPSGIELEEAWRRQVEAAKARYYAAVEHVKALVSQTPTVEEHECGPEMVEAQRQEEAARAEYVRALQAFTDLVIHRKKPAQAEGVLEMDDEVRRRGGGDRGA